MIQTLWAGRSETGGPFAYGKRAPLIRNCLKTRYLLAPPLRDTIPESPAQSQLVHPGNVLPEPKPIGPLLIKPASTHHQAKQAFVAVGGLLRQGGSVLLVRQQKPNDPELKWALPGGYVERNESLLDALRREISEETGLDVLEIGSLLYTVHLIISSTGEAFVVLVFQIEAWRGELQPSDSLVDPEEKILDAQFVPVKEAIQRLEQGFRFANEPAIEHLRGNSPLGAVWIYQGDPAAGDRLVDYVPQPGRPG